MHGTQRHAIYEYGESIVDKGRCNRMETLRITKISKLQNMGFRVFHENPIFLIIIENDE